MTGALSSDFLAENGSFSESVPLNKRTFFFILDNESHNLFILNRANIEEFIFSHVVWIQMLVGVGQVAWGYRFIFVTVSQVRTAF